MSPSWTGTLLFNFVFKPVLLKNFPPFLEAAPPAAQHETTVFQATITGLPLTEKVFTMPLEPELTFF